MEFALVRFLGRKARAPGNFHRVISADGIAREPDFAIRALADALEQRVIRDELGGALLGGGLGGFDKLGGFFERAGEDVLLELEPDDAAANGPRKRTGNLDEGDDRPTEP